METVEAIEETESEKYLREYCQDFSKIEDENGMDLMRLRENLMLTPLERLRKAERFIHGVFRLRELREQNRDKK
jgi:septin family protein